MIDRGEQGEDSGQEHVWTSFVDLLSGLVAIMLLTLLLPELVKHAKAQKDMAAARQSLEARNRSGMPTYEFHPIQFDQEGRTLTLGEGAFEKDSYHLAADISEILRRCAPCIETYLGAHIDNQIAIEGHSDALEFKPGGTIRSSVGNINSNYALSAMRAVAAREFLVDTFGINDEGRQRYGSRVTVAGYGCNNLRKGTSGPTDPRNRRVEIRFSGRNEESFRQVQHDLGMVVKII
jgi:flagellar motor protein MotB